MKDPKSDYNLFVALDTDNEGEVPSEVRSHFSNTKGVQAKPTSIRPRSLKAVNQLEKKQMGFKTASQIRFDSLCYTLNIHKARGDFCHSLKKCRHLSQLSLHLEDNSIKDLNHFAYCTKFLSLSVLSLDLTIQRMFTATNMQVISQCLKNLSHSLHTLHINLKSSLLPLGDEELTIFSSGISRLACLSTLSITLPDFFNVNNTGMDAFTSSLRDKTLLSSLTLNLGGCSRIRGASLKNLFSCFKRFTHLAEFSLSLDNCYLSSNDITHLAFSIWHMKLLNRLSLSFSRCREDTSHDMLALFYWLPGIKKLTTLKLSFKMSLLYDDDLVEGVSSYLAVYSGLSVLKLDFSNCTNISDHGVDSLCFGLHRHCDSLSSLTLRLNKCNRISRSAVESLSQGIKKLRLKSLTLGFRDCECLEYYTINRSTLSLNYDLKLIIEKRSSNYLISRALERYNHVVYDMKKWNSLR